MKNLFLSVLCLFVSVSAHAGSSGCTNVTNVTTNSSYSASASDCIIRLVNPDQTSNLGSTSVAVYLPHTTGAAGSAEFTIQEDSAFYTDACTNYDNGNGDPNPSLNVFTVCQPNGWTISSVDAGASPTPVTVDSSSSTTLAGQYIPDPNNSASYSRQSVRLIWDGASDFAATYTNWR